MACIFKTESYSFIDQAVTTVLISVKESANNQLVVTDDLDFTNAERTEGTREYADKPDHLQREISRWRWSTDLFAIHSPFRTDTQVERMKREEEGTVAESALKKRTKRKLKSRLSESEQKIVELINQFLPTIQSEARQLGHLTVGPSDIGDNNKVSRTASMIPGPGDLFRELCDRFDQQQVHDENEAFVKDRVINKISIVTDKQLVRASSVAGAWVYQQSAFARWISVDGMKFLIPQCSTFLTSSFDYFTREGYLEIKENDGFDLIVVDPPWENKSVKRKKGYSMLDEYDLIELQLSELTSKTTLVCVWVPPNTRFKNFVKKEVFPIWGIQWLADWTWLKLTQHGEPVYDLLSSGKKTYENLVIGTPKKMSESPINNDPIHPSTSEGQGECSVAPTELEIPTNHIFASVPCALHSKKPPLQDVLRDYLPDQPKCLELFARNLQPHWTSWGNEPLLHQHQDFYTEVK